VEGVRLWAEVPLHDLLTLKPTERRRLQLLSVLIMRPNLLILDEPSCDLDLQTLQALETYLIEEFKGVLLIVSHDRFFADKVTDHLFVFDGNGQISDFIGTLSEYSTALVELENQTSAGNRPRATASNGSIAATGDSAQKKEDLNKIRQAKKSLGRLESDIEKLTQQVGKLETTLAQSSNEGWSVLADLAEKVQAAKDVLAEKELLWLEAAELVESRS
jgi:ABC transport system ATP-binding/permease protein